MRRGLDRERQIRRLLEADGWVVLRSAGSLGPVDLVALRATFRPRLVEVKSTAGGPYERFGPDDRAAMQWLAARAGADAWLAWWPPRGELRWIPDMRWPVARALAR